MDMIYSEGWARTITVSRQEAVNEYKKHCLTGDDLTADLGFHARYKGAAVLDALGY